MDRPPPVIEVAVEPKSAADFERMAAALGQMTREDEDLHYRADADSGQAIVAGREEGQLDRAVDRLLAEFKVEANIGQPQVAYCATITKTVEHDYTHKTRSGGSSQFARIKFRIEPNESGKGFRFVSDVPAGAIPAECVAGVEAAVRAAMSFGPRIGFPMVDLTFTLTGGAHHDVDSSLLAFEIASRAGFSEAVAKAGPIILEPIMRLEVVTPEDCVGDVIGDLNLRRSQIRRAGAKGAAQVVEALVPLANMFGYVNSLRAMTHGRAHYAMVFDHYERTTDRVDPDDRFPPAAAMRASA